MRFLMNSPVALTSTAVDSRVRTKLSLDALGLSCSRVLGASLAPILRPCRQGHIDSSQSFGTRLILLLKATPAAIAAFESSPRPKLHLSLRYFSHTLSHVSRRLRPTFE
jgi:hypothetical protein